MLLVKMGGGGGYFIDFTDAKCRLGHVLSLGIEKRERNSFDKLHMLIV